ncbi:MAG: GMC family oxidoreductase [Planctomycetota bacterium]
MNGGGVSREVCDYVIVGGGSAGCVLASRLSEQPDVDVLLIERGGRYSRLALGVPLLGMLNIKSRLHTHRTSPQPECRHRRIELPVARGLGGGSSINAMIYVRGGRRAYDRWEEQGAQGWSYENVLPYFRRMEDFDGGADRYHGVDGPLGVSRARYRSSFGSAFIEACEETGLPRNDDFTGADQFGAGFYQLTQAHGERSSTALGYLRPARSRGNLRVWSRTRVDRVAFDGDRAVAVHCRGTRGQRTVSVRREVILSAGALETPKILMLSGVGAADELGSLGITPVRDLPGVGEGLQDHVRCRVVYAHRTPVLLSPPALLLPFLRWCVARDGIFTSTKVAGGAFLRLSDASDLVDCQLVAQWAGSPPNRDAVDIHTCLMDVESRGSVRLSSKDPEDDPVVNPNYLSAQRELDIMIQGIRFTRSLARTRALEAFGLQEELLPGPEVRSAGELASYVRGSVETCFHPAGTCRMGTDEDAVVDPMLRVRGLEGLRIVDASIMPSLINGNTNGPTIMIAEKAADLIRQG